MAVVLEVEEKLEKNSKNRANGKFTLHRLRVEDYDKMIECGIFDEDEQIELWEGALVEMSPKGIKHRFVTTRTTDYFYKNLRNQAVIQVKDPIRLNDFSEPEPDIALIEPPLEKYDSRHPTPDDILLLMEIAETSVVKDRSKAASYARSGIRQYLLFNLNTDEIEDYREPADDGYRFKRTYTKSESFNLVAFPEVEIKVSDLLPSKSDEK